MKKGKSITFQLQDQLEKDLFEYCGTIHNFSGTMKRLLMASEGFKRYQEGQNSQVPLKPLKTATEGGRIQIKIGG